MARSTPFPSTAAVSARSPKRRLSAFLPCVSPALPRKRPLPLLQRPLRARTVAGLALTHLTAARAQRARKAPILTLTNAKLTELAKEMGIDTAKLKTKAQLIAAITDVPLEDAIAEDDDGVDDGEAPPVLTPEAPVV